MTATLAIRVATYLLVYDGLLSLYLAGLLALPAALLAAGAVAASWWDEWLRARVSAGMGLALIGAAGLASAADLLFLSDSLLDGLVRLLLILLLYRLFTRRSLRDVRDAAFLSFFMLVAASAVTFGVAFLFVFVVLLVVGTWMLILYHMLSESERAPERTRIVGGARAALARPLLGLSLAASVATFLIAVGLFFIIPRVGQAALPLRTRVGPMVSGFSDRVELGAFGQIEADPAVVMRVQIVEGPPEPERLANLRWRGIAFDHFNGWAWSVGRPSPMTLIRSLDSQFGIDVPRQSGPIVKQEIYLEPIGTEVLFGAPRVLQLGIRADAVTVDDMGSISVPVPTARLQYTVHSQLEPIEPPDAGEARAAGWARLQGRERFLQIPPLPARIAGLAREVTAGSRSSYEAALRLTAFLSREFRYTLLLERTTRLEPLEEFLFVRRSGNCEYFAASLAVMLRTLGIPARVVSGFQRGEWNPYGRYFMVRLRDAHSWVEAYFDGVGWVTLDPSPRGEGEDAMPGPVSLYLDALRMRWYRYVVNWSFRDQLMVAGKVHDRVSAWRQWRLEAPEAGSLPRPVLPALVVLVGVVGLVLWTRARPARTARAVARIPGFYQGALRALGRLGLSPEPDETAREFSVRVAAVAPACGIALARITDAYERCRFGAATLTEPELAEVADCLDTLEGLASRPRDR
jgi:hypothetical protein